MKKILVVLFVLIMVMGIVACGSKTGTAESNSSEATPSSSSSNSSSSNTTVDLTDDEIEKRAAYNLYQALSETKSNPNPAFYDIDQTTYHVASIKEGHTTTFGDCWYVKGTFTLYDDYGKFYKSGTFEVRIDKEKADNAYTYQHTTFKLD